MPQTKRQSKPQKAERPIRCATCGVEKTILKRIPKGWKHPNESYFCGNCWNKEYVLRAISLEVVEPLGMTWDEMMVKLREMWRETTRCSNWMITQLAIQDAKPEQAAEKMPPKPATYLYPQATPLFPTLPTGSVAAIERSVTEKYRAKRKEVFRLCTASLPSFRYPQPYPIPGQSWTALMERKNAADIYEVPVVSMPIGGTRIKLRLKGSPRYYRQLLGFKAILLGKATPGEAALYKQGDHLMCKLVAWLPRRAKEERSPDLLYVRSTPDALLTAVGRDAKKAWMFHGDQVRRWVAEHRRALQHWADDSKAEARPDPALNARRAGAAVKYHNRMNTAADQAAAFVVNYARRRKFSGIVYDESDHSWCPQFVWYRLRQRIEVACDEHGLSFEAKKIETETDEEPEEELPAL